MVDVTNKPPLPPKTTAQFRKRCEALFHKNNPDAGGAALEWVYGPKAVTFPTGLKGFAGQLKVTAPGYRPRIMVATYATGCRLTVH